MNIFLAQQNYIIGDFAYNTAKIIDAIKTAKAQGGELIVFPELAICGYPPRDFLEFDDFIDACQQSIDLICKEAGEIAVLVGAPSRNPVPQGKNLFNSAYFIYENKVQQIINKTLLPNYDIFDEYRYFEPSFDWSIVSFKGLKLAVTICEDIWDMEDDLMYRFSPMEKLIEQSPDLMINLSASPFDYTHAEDRLWVVSKNCVQYQLPMLYCNTVGSQTEIVFDGGSLIADAQGNILKECPYFEEVLVAVDFTDSKLQLPVVKPVETLPLAPCNPVTFDYTLNIDRIHQALVMGIRQYFEKMGFKKAVVASSGGIDSAVTLALACEALGPENVHALLMPSQFSTGHSVSDAEQLSKNLNNHYDIIPIKKVYDAFESSLEPVFKDLPFNVTEENIQARTRGTLVMALANKFNYILLNTSNKSELATGYGTLYGDMAGGIAVLGDVYKMQVFELARYLNRDKEIIPEHIITKPPSAELRPDQKDSDSLPDYSILDTIIYQYVERRQSPQDIIAQGFDTDLVKRVITMINRNEYKRNQFCPIIRVSPKSFGIGRRMPIVGKYLG
ncbi:NAD+ synthase [Taibaiella sp. KBW10]|uniref:NAD+ synthase n=1 Tax=Taibaiella sp. KBW10 TaxID=2153357 RepID=UPI000F5B5D91|nr:NAD+ synthase [Taibaiella sp. KBW10]RQO30074.1 NAD+ synthase [Taibaiella sp. KBW10]